MEGFPLKMGAGEITVRDRAQIVGRPPRGIPRPSIPLRLPEVWIRGGATPPTQCTGSHSHSEGHTWVRHVLPWGHGGGLQGKAVDVTISFPSHQAIKLVSYL